MYARVISYQEKLLPLLFLEGSADIFCARRTRMLLERFPAAAAAAAASDLRTCMRCGAKSALVLSLGRFYEILSPERGNSYAVSEVHHQKYVPQIRILNLMLRETLEKETFSHKW